MMSLGRPPLEDGGGRPPPEDGGGRRKTSGGWKTSGRRNIVCDWLVVATPTAGSLYKNESSSG